MYFVRLNQSPQYLSQSEPQVIHLASVLSIRLHSHQDGRQELHDVAEGPRGVDQALALLFLVGSAHCLSLLLVEDLEGRLEVSLELGLLQPEVEELIADEDELLNDLRDWVFEPLDGDLQNLLEVLVHAGVV